jgi:hypothetical protein
MVRTSAYAASAWWYVAYGVAKQQLSHNLHADCTQWCCHFWPDLECGTASANSRYHFTPGCPIPSLLQICNDWAAGGLLQSKAWAFNTLIHTTLDWPMRK